MRNSASRLHHLIKGRGYSSSSSPSALSIKRKKGWESVVGLEVHAQIATRSKLFSKGGSTFGTPVNTLVTLFDAAIPGTLPVLNKGCVEAGVLTGLALSCELNKVSWFDRKHYFYSDLPAGYQITQQRRALGNKGELNFVVYTPGLHPQPYEKKSRIRQLQLEQDSGKSLHVPSGNRSLIDLNRAGLALMEIVFEPDLKDGEEAGALVKELCLILQRIGTCSCKMDEGALRVDANISVNRVGEPLGTRTEVKNLGSIRSLVNAIEFEVSRQIGELEKGNKIINETRGYDVENKQTLPMRDKEEMQDYRFMPEPNLPPLKLRDGPSQDEGAVDIAEVKILMKELPQESRKRLMTKFGIKLETALMIVGIPGFLTFYESVMAKINPKLGIKTANFIAVEVLERLNKQDLTLEECPVNPDHIGELIQLLDGDKVNFIKATEILGLLMNKDKRNPSQIVEQEGWIQVTDSEEIRKTCEAIIQENLSIVTKYRSNKKQKYFNKLVGKVKDKTQGKYDMKKVTEILNQLLVTEEDKDKP